MDCVVHWIAKSRTRLSKFDFQEASVDLQAGNGGCPPGAHSSLGVPLYRLPITGFWTVISGTSPVRFLVLMLPQDLARDTLLFVEVTESQSSVKNTLDKHTLSLLHP